ncbi:His/Gly/Thr/Pro-type tRNA ligase C-terminal domain-containing protein [Pseudomonas sp. NPDC087697]|uniref:His/Gly/Thr/Pro-type tRNA ligase C-terminal domain-containing protein n=1 Tax=Pseudomonas sp. NPDC087697 TaxID=3364447 RepID=UPI003821DF58
MIHITLPDGSLREYDQPLSVFEVAASIGIGLAKAAVAGRVNGTLVDCAFVISQDARVNIVTPREPEGLEILRRSCAVLLAMAIRQLYAEVKLYTGSVVGDGFYCEFTHEQSLRPDDLKLIETRMYALAATNHSINHVLSRSRLGNFEDVGDGPHVPSTRMIEAFTLAHLCGTSRQRIYGVCWANQQELDEWRAPQQAVVVNIDERQVGYAQSVTEALRRAGLRANSDVRKKNICNKIRHHTLQAVPYLLVIGDKEMDGGFVSLRSGKGEDLGRMSVEAVCERLRIEVGTIAGKAGAWPCRR